MLKKLAYASVILLAVTPNIVMADCDAGSFVQHLSALDRTSSSGTTLTNAAGIIQQDRFNVFNGRNVDLYDTPDDVYSTKEARAKLNNDVAALLNQIDSSLIEQNENAVVTINFEKCIDELPSAVSLGVSQLTVLPDGSGAYAINHLPYTDYHGFFRYENISNSLREQGHVFTRDEEAEMTIAFIGNPDYAVIQLPSSLYCGSLGCNFLVLDHFGNLVADVYGVSGEVYVRRSKSVKSELLFFNGDGVSSTVELEEKSQAEAPMSEGAPDIFVVANTLPPDDYLSLRTEPSTKVGTRITTMPNGTELNVLERGEAGWWYVEILSTGQRGWAKSGSSGKSWIIRNSAKVNSASDAVVVNDAQEPDRLELEIAGSNQNDGQGFLVKRGLGISSAKELNGAVICVQAGTTAEMTLNEFLVENSISYSPMAVADEAEAQRNYLAGRCDAITANASDLAAMRLSFPNPNEHVILPETIKKDKLNSNLAEPDAAETLPLTEKELGAARFSGACAAVADIADEILKGKGKAGSFDDLRRISLTSAQNLLKNPVAKAEFDAFYSATREGTVGLDDDAKSIMMVQMASECVKILCENPSSCD